MLWTPMITKSKRIVNINKYIYKYKLIYYLLLTYYLDFVFFLHIYQIIQRKRKSDMNLLSHSLLTEIKYEDKRRACDERTSLPTSL